ncbi:Kinesin motor domain [Dillenia turbinata]|uniref:Kinesin motor domain n=1 Tax=Dillenia turbinata TaxID=194707 RepID=A0AAN8VC06_9MAGN
MKHFMQPRTQILRENHTQSNPSPMKQRPVSSTPRKQKLSKENAPPPSSSDLNTMPQSSSSSTLKPSQAAKIRSPLPPRPLPSSSSSSSNPNPNPLKRKLSTETLADNALSAASDSGVRVIVRMRPPNKDEEEGEMIVQKLSTDSLSILGQTFTFDSVADTNSSQNDIFQLVGAPLVENCIAGFNSSVFAYGQTGSGKTYTMWGPANALLEENLSSDQQGLTPRVFEKLFSRINEEQIKHADKELRYQCRCSFLEIYNEQITDLLDPNQKNLQIREDVKTGVYVENLTEECVCTMEDVTQLLVKGLSNRRTGATSINAESSRSHSVFTCIVESRCKSMADGLSSFKTSRINLVDLAGSERQKLTGAAGDRLKEAGNINRSLSQLGNLIYILAEVSQTGKQRHIPYRDSRLTFLLQESLGGNAKLAMICAISPAQSCKSETFSTLRFAQRAKAIKNKAVVNEVMQDDVNFLREVIRQLKDELLRMKANGNSANSTGSYSTGWNARRSLNLLKFSLNRPMTLPHIEDDSDEEMEIDEEAVEKLCVQVGLQSKGGEASSSIHVTKAKTDQLDPQGTFSVGCSGYQGSEVTDVNMEEAIVCEQVENHEIMVADHGEPATDVEGSAAEKSDLSNRAIPSNENNLINPVSTVCDGNVSEEPTEEKTQVFSPIKKLVDGELYDKLEDGGSLCPLDLVGGVSADDLVPSVPTMIESDELQNFAGPANCLPPSNLSIEPCEISPLLKSPTLSLSPRVNRSSRKSLRTSSMLTASQKNLKEGIKLGRQIKHLSCGQSLGLGSQSTQVNENLSPTEHLAASIHRGLEIIDNHRQSSPLKISPFRFSYKPAELKPIMAGRVDVGIQTIPQDNEITKEELVVYLCSNCNSRTSKSELKEANEGSDMQLVPVDGTKSAEKSKNVVPKAVEKVLAGAIRREMALEEFCAKQTAEIMQLNRLVQQYKHERDCNAIIQQTREDKIIRLESLMDGVLPTEEFMEEEFVALRHEHELLKEKYENHPEVLSSKIELKRIADELERYKNYFDLDERDVLLEEIRDLKSQLQCYVDCSPKSSRKQSSLLKLTYSCEPIQAPIMNAIRESSHESAEEKLEQERIRWTEAESKWICLSEELRNELEASRALAEKQKQELYAEKKCSEEVKEALQMAMESHARMLEQYAELQEKHISLLARHRKMQDGVEDVKKAAARAGVRGAECKFINALAAEISALKVEREKERRYLRDENKGLQAQLRDTVEAVHAAGELVVRLKEAEEAVASSKKRVKLVEEETQEAYRQIEKLKKKHEKEINTLNQLLLQSRPPDAVQAPHHDNTAKYDSAEPHSQRWKEELEPFYNTELGEPSSWFSGYDRCNI